MIKVRNDLSADGLHKILDSVFKKIPEGRTNLKNIGISMKDAAKSAYAMFSLKCPSALNFQEKAISSMEGGNIKSLYGIQHIPSDTQMRTILDPVSPDHIAPAFKKIFTAVQRGKDLRPFVWDVNNSYLGAMDATGFFSSTNVNCPSCLVKELKTKSIKEVERQIQKDVKKEIREEGKNKEELTKKMLSATIKGIVATRLAAYLEDNKITVEQVYHHQLLGLSMVHPDKKTTVPFCPEAIVNADGAEKNDCEINAAKRLLERFKNDHPHLKMTILGDDIYSRAPFIRLLQQSEMSMILVAKESSHSYLFDYVESLEKIHPTDQKEFPLLKKVEIKDSEGEKIIKKLTHTFRFVNGVPLNDSNEDLLINFLEHWEITEYFDKDRVFHKEETFHSSWVTDIEITEENVYKIMRAGRCRWNIENCVFNTLKNQGYGLEHNYGHGKKNLSTNFAMLMMLAFLVDQVQELSCKLFQQAKNTMRKKSCLWERIRGLLTDFKFSNWEMLLKKIVAAQLLLYEDMQYSY